MCAVESCDNPARVRGWCVMHYTRWKRHGDPAIVRGGVDWCAVAECERPFYGLTFCRLHYRRFKTNGDPAVVQDLRDRKGLANPAWRGDQVSYSALHTRIRKAKGSASEHLCVHCLGPANQWAYDNVDPGERTQVVTGSTVRYSTKPDHYMPLCTPCHKRFDIEERKTA